MSMKHFTALIALSVFAFTACSDDMGLGNASDDEREEILTALTESGFFADDFGAEGVTTNQSVTSGAVGFAAARALAVAPFRWGRFHGLPVSRHIEINVEDNVATVTKQLDFDGTFLVGVPETGDVVNKPLVESLFHSAVLEQVTREDDQGNFRRGWRLTALSPVELKMTNADERTVAIDSVKVFVNEELVLMIENASELLELETRVPHWERGTTVAVHAYVTNETPLDEDQELRETYVFLHLFHASELDRRWIRVPMEYDAENERYVRSWEIRQTGRERLVVDAIDEGAFDIETEGGYRANVWGIPYRVEDLVQ